MAWLGKTTIPPGHPFASTQIGFGKKLPILSKPATKRQQQQPPDQPKKVKPAKPSR